MSTTVAYKGNTITTVNNQTRVLNTSGKWMEGDITLVDVTASAPTGTKQIPITQNGTVTEDVAAYANAQITVNVSGGGTPSLTQHTIYFEFSDGTNTTVTAYWDGTFISDAITATTPTTYNNKTVTLAQLDGVSWYEPVAIPLNTELIDYTKCTRDTAIESDGTAVPFEWWYTSDYVRVESGMTFSYICAKWFHIGIYDTNKTTLTTISAQNDGTPDGSNENHVRGTLSGNELPNGAAYVRLTSGSATSNEMSLIRTA